MIWHLVVSEWRWDLHAYWATWRFFVAANHSPWLSHGLEVWNAVFLGYLYFRREKVWRFLIRMTKRKLGPPDGNGWRARITYERKGS